MHQSSRPAISTRPFIAALFLAHPFTAAAEAPEPPAPLVDLQFSADAHNSGTLRGDATLTEYAPGQGPAFGPGSRGTGLDLTASSRGGGSDETRAGGAALLNAPSLGKLARFTITLWCKPIGHNAPARLLNIGPRADLVISDGTVSFKVRSNNSDAHFNVPRSELDLAEGQWHFIALTHDRSTGEARIHHAAPGGAPRSAATWSNVPPPDAGAPRLEVGNFNGIRPFHGLIDSVRIYGSILTDAQIASVAAADASPPRALTQSLLSAATRPTFLRHSDACFTSRSKHTNSVQTLQAFRANRLLWSYAADADFAKACRSAGAETFQGAINSLPGTTETAAHALDFDGKPMVAPWMRAFSPKSPVYWACNNRPRFMEVCIDRAKKAIEAGADMLQFDDWSLVVSASGWGGACFCDNCMAAFGDDVRRHAPKEELTTLSIPHAGPFDYRAYLRSNHGITNAATYMAQKRSLPTTTHFETFQRRSVREFFKALKQRIDAIAGRHVPLSINTNLSDPSERRQFLTDITDFVQGETLRFPLDLLAIAAKTAESLGKWHVFVTQSLDVPEARAGIASVYALGQLPMVPWDMYMGSDEKKIQPRGWGTVEQYGDLFYFVRDNPALFDGFETVARAGLIVDLDHFDRARTLAACRRLLDAQIPFALVPVGHSFFDVPLDAARMSAFDALLLIGSIDDLAESDRAALAKAAADAPLLDADRTPDDALAHLSIADVWGPRDIHVIARARRDPKCKTLLLHVLNRASQGSELKWVSILLRTHALPGTKIAAARWHAPGQPPNDLEIETLPAGPRILIPRIREWGIIEIQF